MTHTWKVDDRFRMYFAVTKTTHNKLTCTPFHTRTHCYLQPPLFYMPCSPVSLGAFAATGTYFRGTVVEVDPRPEGPVAWDPWETVTIQWDPTANDPGAVERVNPCTAA